MIKWANLTLTLIYGILKKKVGGIFWIHTFSYNLFNRSAFDFQHQDFSMVFYTIGSALGRSKIFLQWFCKGYVIFVYLSKLTHWTTRINNYSIGIGIECLLKKYLNQRNQKIEMKFLRGCIHLKVFHGVGRCDVISFYFEELSPSF